MSDDWNSMQVKGGIIAGLGGAWIGDFACHLVGVAFGIDIPTGVEIGAEFAGVGVLGLAGGKVGAELDWRRKVALERRERDASPDLDGAVPLPPGR